jgi:hypothetical protein
VEGVMDGGMTHSSNIYIIVYIIIITKGLAVETEREGMARFKIGYIWLFFFCCYFQLIFVIVKPVGSHPPNGYNSPLREEDCLEGASAVIFFAFCGLSLLCVLCICPHSPWLTDVKRDQINNK